MTTDSPCPPRTVGVLHHYGATGQILIEILKDSFPDHDIHTDPERPSEIFFVSADYCGPRGGPRQARALRDRYHRTEVYGLVDTPVEAREFDGFADGTVRISEVFSEIVRYAR